MVNTQFDARRRLIHVLAVEGIPRMMLAALLGLVDRHAGAIGGDPPVGPVPLHSTLVLVGVAVDADTVDAVPLAAALLSGMSFCIVPITALNLTAGMAALVEPWRNSGTLSSR